MILTVELAGVPISVRCEHERNASFLAEYRTDREPAFSVGAEEADLATIRRRLAEQKEKEGVRNALFADHYVENNALHALICEELAARYGVVMFHGSALCMDGQAVIFTAKSGTGKSTQARLWRETFGDRVWMINDDKPLLRVCGGQVMAFGSPWDGKHHLSRNACAPVRAVMEVRRSAENRVERMNGADAFQLAVRQGFLAETPEARVRAFATERELVKRAAFFRLYCNMEREAARTAWEEVSRL